MKRNNLTAIAETFESRPSEDRQKYATLTHGAQFIEVKVDPDVGNVRVTPAIEVTACGKIMNPKTSRSQEIGGVVWGIGMALQEATEIDDRYGRSRIRTCSTITCRSTPMSWRSKRYSLRRINVVNPLGVKGMGEARPGGHPWPLIANAVFHATGKRIRDLPITPDKLL